MTQSNEDVVVARVGVPASVSVIVVDGEVTELEVTLGDGPGQYGSFRLITSSGDDAIDDAAVKAADGMWNLPWSDVPQWLNISS